MFKPWNYDEAATEMEYIASVDALRPGKSFNDDPHCFARYCNMQANHALASAFPLIAHEMAQHRDIAHPTFRSDMRAIGWYVEGTFCAESYDMYREYADCARKIRQARNAKKES